MLPFIVLLSGDLVKLFFFFIPSQLFIKEAFFAMIYFFHVIVVFFFIAHFNVILLFFQLIICQFPFAFFINLSMKYVVSVFFLYHQKLELRDWFEPAIFFSNHHLASFLFLIFIHQSVGLITSNMQQVQRFFFSFLPEFFLLNLFIVASYTFQVLLITFISIQFFKSFLYLFVFIV